MIVLVSLLAAVPAANPPRLRLPVRCVLGATCAVQKLPDHAPGPAIADFRCGALSTDGHDGTDFRIADESSSAPAVPVLAAAAGRVARVRDGEPDVSIRQRGDTQGKDAGNGVVIDHGGGWTTQYSHLRRGSLMVRPGQHVAAGEAIGLVGLSGDTEYLHLHFSVRRDDIAVDPFTGQSIMQRCGAVARPAPLWADAVAYHPTTVVAVGFASGVAEPARPSQSGLRRDLDPALPLLLWAQVIGAKPGDAQQLTIAGPGGERVLSLRSILAKGGLSWFAFGGRRPPAAGWRPGTYEGRYELRRAGMPVAVRTVAVRLGAAVDDARHSPQR